MKKMTLTFPPEIIDALKRKAKDEGLLFHSALARAIILKELQSEAEEADCRIIKVAVKNYKELKAYVDAKRLGSLEVFATYAMELAMARAPLSEAQKARVVGNDDL